MILVVQNETTGVNGHHAVKRVVKENKNELELMSVRVPLTTFKLEHAVSNFPRCHIIRGLNALQRVLVVSWFELPDIFVVKCSGVTPPLVVQRDTDKNRDH